MNFPALGATIFLLLANGFFVAAEFALIAGRRSKIEQLAREGDWRADLALRSIRELSFMLAGAQLGITMASLGLGYVTEPAIAHLIEAGLERVAEIPETLLHTIGFTVALAIVVFLHMVIGEMAPKNIAIAEPEKSALWLAVPIRAYANIFRPFIYLLNALANGGLRLIRVEPQNEVTVAHTAEEITHMVEESADVGLLDHFERTLLTGAATFGERDAGAAMIPRTELTAVPINATPTEIEKAVLDSGHSRLPVYAGDIDHIAGFFHAKDLLRIPQERLDEPLPRRLIRDLPVTPESRKLHPLLVDMRRNRTHIALVVDEHGGTAGVVTIEDLLEELVGEIRDEYDVGEQDIEQIASDRWIVPGTLRIDEVKNLLGLELPEGDYETMAGFVMGYLGRIPRRRDVIELNGWRLRVHRMHRRKLEQLLVERAA